MWIKMTGTYADRIGLFLKDIDYDLPPDVIKQLPEGSYKKTKAPWDKYKTKHSTAEKETTQQEAANKEPLKNRLLQTIGLMPKTKNKDAQTQKTDEAKTDADSERQAVSP